MNPFLESLNADSPGYRPLAKIPERRSSLRSSSHVDTRSSELSVSTSRKSSVSVPHITQGPRFVSTRGPSASPIKHQSVESARTIVPAVAPSDILDHPTLTHARVNLDSRLFSSLFIGGATIEGEAKITIDHHIPEAKRHALPLLSIHRLSIHVLGVERFRERQEIFQALTTHILHVNELPIIDDVIKPFRVDLPVHMGPPPYKTKKAGIRYLLSVLVEFWISEQIHHVRQTKEVEILTVHDPEKALLNLSAPLVVRDQIRVASSSIHITAGIHRQTWISGYPLFVDLEIDNRSKKSVRRIDLQLAKLMCYYSHSAPSYKYQKASQLRAPDEMNGVIVAKKTVLASSDTIRPETSVFRTVSLSIPSNLVSIDTGRFIGVRFFLSVNVTIGFSTRLRVRLPITLIHPNSIDIPPNALAQVTASIERKHQQSRMSSANMAGSMAYRYRPGQAFVAARKQSMLQIKDVGDGERDMDSIRRAIDDSPRRFVPRTLTDKSSPSQRMKIMKRRSAAVLGSGDTFGVFDGNKIGVVSPRGPGARRRSSMNHVRTPLKYVFPESALTGARDKVSRPPILSYDKSTSLDQRTPLAKIELDTAELETDNGKTSANARTMRDEMTGTMHVRRKNPIVPRLMQSTSGLRFDGPAARNEFDDDASEKENRGRIGKRRFLID